MKPTRKLAGALLVAVAVIGAGSAARNFRRLQIAQAATAAETRRHETVRHQLEESQSELAKTRRENEALRGEGSGVALAKGESMKASSAHPESARAKVGKTAAPAAGQPNTGARPLSTNPIILTAIDPEARALKLKLEEAQVEIVWGPLFTALNLSPERIEKFKTIRIAEVQDSMEYQALADTKPLGLRDPEIAAQFRAGLEATDQQMRSLFSAEEFRIYDAFNKGERFMSQTVEQLAAQLYFTEAPLSASQGMRLMRLLAENSPRRPDPLQLNTNIDTALAQMTTADFSPVQIAALRKLREQQRITQEIEQTLNTYMKRHGVDRGSLSFGLPTLPGKDYKQRSNPPR